MKHVKVKEVQAERVKRLILDNNLMDKSFLVQHSPGCTYFPVKISTKKVKNLLKNYDASIVDIEPKRAPWLPKRMKAKEALNLNSLRGSGAGYDILGNIAVIEVPDATKAADAKRFAEYVMRANRSITTVLRKTGPVEGIYRIRGVKYVAGKRTFAAVYRENGCIFEFDVRKTFFSNRLSYERARMANLARHDKNVMVMFAGVGPFAIEIAKLNKTANIAAIELNPYACRQMAHNVALNKTPNVIPILGDVKRKAARFEDFADRIIMPLPKSSTLFLDSALKIARNGCIVHLYAFVEIDGGTEKLAAAVKEHAKARSYRVRILFSRVVRAYSSKEMEIVLDYKIFKSPRA